MMSVFRGVLMRIAVVLALAATYAWFVDEAIVSETLAAIACGIAGWAVAERVVRTHGVRFALAPRVLGPFLRRIPYAAVRESLDLLGPVLWDAVVRGRRRPGRWIAIGYDRGEPSDPYESGRRTFVIFASNLTPNALPLDIDPQAERMVLHQLVHRRESAADDPRYPI